MTTENNENELMTEEATNTEETAVQTAGGTDAGTETGGSSGSEGTGTGTDAGTDENLPLADQKKAINLQDLIYVKKYINDQVKAFKNKLISDLTNGTVTVKKATNASTASDAAYAISAGRATKDSDGNVIKDTYYKKTDTVANATNANYATSAGKATNDENGNNIASTYRKKSESVVGSATVVKTFLLNDDAAASYIEDYGYDLEELLPSGIYLVVLASVSDGSSVKSGQTIGVVSYYHDSNSAPITSIKSINMSGGRSDIYFRMWTFNGTPSTTRFYLKGYGYNSSNGTQDYQLITEGRVLFIKLADLS